MPEGDTIHRLARAMAPVLQGEPLLELRLRDQGVVSGLAGSEIRAIEALGKHLLISLGAGWVLRVHLGMRGSWHRYAPGEAWRRPASGARCVLSTATEVYVAFEASAAELLRRSDLPLHPVLSRLGPDLLAESVDLDQVAARARDQCRADRAIGELLLDQRVAAGIGNVFKSEILFLEGADPWRTLGELDDASLVGLYRRARALMLQSMALGRRVTVGQPRPGDRLPRGAAQHWVYGRARRPCLRCQTRVATRSQGPQARATYWCPRCQSAT